jgi:hypothetical protein
VFRRCHPNSFTIAKSSIDIQIFISTLYSCVGNSLQRYWLGAVAHCRTEFNVYFKSMSDNLLLTIGAEFMLLMSMMTMASIIAHVTGWT